MILTGHLLVGGAIGVAIAALIPWPWAAVAALGLGILSHHLLDLIPHTDAATFWPDPHSIPRLAIFVVAGEVLCGLTLTGTLFFVQHMTWTFAAGAVGGILPDLFDEMPLWQDGFRRSALGRTWHRVHTRWHCADMSERWAAGLLVDAIVVAGGLGVLLIPR